MMIYLQFFQVKVNFILKCDETFWPLQILWILHYLIIAEPIILFPYKI